MTLVILFRECSMSTILSCRLLRTILLGIWLAPALAIGQQSVGLVLSGGGASGLAHIGVIKALEENNIPIDYITGTSIGAMVGALYASGYSVEQMEAIVNSEQFQRVTRGQIEERHQYYFKEKEIDASWVSIKFTKDSIWRTTLPTNIISPEALDYDIMTMLAGAEASADYNFDSLMIPFRCVASDIEAKQQVVFRDGNLTEAVRASMSYPLYIKPISVNGKLLFDGGLYNNFPVDVMLEEFAPDILIGSNVSSNEDPPREDDVVSQLRNMIVSKTDYSLNGQEGVLIEPSVDVGAFNFSSPARIVDSGYNAAMERIEEIKALVKDRQEPGKLKKNRARFWSSQPPLIFGEIHLDGLSKSQTSYVDKLLTSRKDTEISIAKMKTPFFRVLSDRRIRGLYPKAVFNKTTRRYDLFIKAKKENDVVVDFGGNLASRPINQAFVGVTLNRLGKTAASVSANGYFGKLYTSIQGSARLDIPGSTPFSIEPSFTLNRWNYFESEATVFEDEDAAYLIQSEAYGSASIGMPVKNRGRVRLGGTFFNLQDDYYQNRSFNRLDTADKTELDGVSGFLEFERSTQNYKLYANRGSYFRMNVRATEADERYSPGSTSETDRVLRDLHGWWQASLMYDNIYKQKGRVRLGIHAEAMYSTQGLFNNYTASILRSPAFQPTIDSKSLFLESFRAYQFAAIGHQFIIRIIKDVDLRLEGYLFQPYRYVINRNGQELPPVILTDFEKRYTVASANTVYHSPLGPISVSVNYYNNLPEISLVRKTPVTFLFHFGYIIFNDRALD